MSRFFLKTLSGITLIVSFLAATPPEGAATCPENKHSSASSSAKEESPAPRERHPYLFSDDSGKAIDEMLTSIFFSRNTGTPKSITKDPRFLFYFASLTNKTSVNLDSFCDRFAYVKAEATTTRDLISRNELSNLWAKLENNLTILTATEATSLTQHLFQCFSYPHFLLQDVNTKKDWPAELAYRFILERFLGVAATYLHFKLADTLSKDFQTAEAENKKKLIAHLVCDIYVIDSIMRALFTYINLHGGSATEQLLSMCFNNKMEPIRSDMKPLEEDGFSPVATAWIKRFKEYGKTVANKMTAASIEDPHVGFIVPFDTAIEKERKRDPRRKRQRGNSMRATGEPTDAPTDVSAKKTFDTWLTSVLTYNQKKPQESANGLKDACHCIGIECNGDTMLNSTIERFPFLHTLPLPFHRQYLTEINKHLPTSIALTLEEPEEAGEVFTSIASPYTVPQSLAELSHYTPHHFIEKVLLRTLSDILKEQRIAVAHTVNIIDLLFNDTSLESTPKPQSLDEIKKTALETLYLRHFVKLLTLLVDREKMASSERNTIVLKKRIVRELREVIILKRAYEFLEILWCDSNENHTDDFSYTKDTTSNIKARPLFNAVHTIFNSIPPTSLEDFFVTGSTLPVTLNLASLANPEKIAALRTKNRFPASLSTIPIEEQWLFDISTALISPEVFGHSLCSISDILEETSPPAKAIATTLERHKSLLTEAEAYLFKLFTVSTIEEANRITFVEFGRTTVNCAQIKAVKQFLRLKNSPHLVSNFSATDTLACTKARNEERARQDNLNKASRDDHK